MVSGTAPAPQPRAATGCIRRSIVTRPADQAADWVQALTARGIDAVALPLMGIAPAADPAAIEVAWRQIGQWATLMFVSPNAAAQFFAHRPAGCAWPASVQAASPGPGTSQALRALGVPAGQLVEPAAHAGQFDSDALWQVLRQQPWSGRRVLVVRGEGGRDWLAEQWQAAGAKVDFLAAYQRMAPQLSSADRLLLGDALFEPERHLWLFSSSESIGHLEALVAARDGQGPVPHGQALALATHPRIGARARQAGFGRVVECRPTLAAVVACIQSLQPCTHPGHPPAAQ